MPAKAALLLALLDEEVLEIIKRRLSAEHRADLILEVINQHRPLTTEQKAELAGVTPSAMRHRKRQK